MKRGKESLRGWILGAVLWNLLFLLPVLVIIAGAVAARWSYPDVLPGSYNGRGVLFILRNAEGIGRALSSSVGYSLAVVTLTIALTVLPASVFARYEFPGRRLVEAIFISPILIPAITWAMGLHFLLIRFGLSDSTVGVVLVLTAASYPYMLRALIAGFRGIDPDLDRCAANLGAGSIRRLVTIGLPLLVPAMISGGSVVFLVAFSDYFLVFLVGGGVVRSFTGYLFPYLAAADRPPASALTLLFLAVPLALFYVTDRFVSGFYRRRGIG